MSGEPSFPLLIAHRGMSQQYPENTLPAFEAAIEAGADMLEFDIALTSDGAFVVIHDDTLMRTTDSDGFVCHHPSSELRKMDAGHWFGSAEDTIHVPMLDDVLKQIAGRIPLNIEIKPFFPLNQFGRMQAALSRLATILDERGLKDEVILSSSNFFLLEYLHELDPELHLGLIYRKPLTDFPPEVVGRTLGIYSLHPWHLQTTPDMIETMHAMGVKVYAYTVNSEARLRQLMAIGVDGVFTDTPDLLRAALKAA